MTNSMQYRQVPNSELELSVIGLGTMTWGSQNSASEAYQQLNYAIEQGVNLVDTAEMYPVPPIRESCFETERIIGNWFKSSGRRDEVVLATKVVGLSSHIDYIRDGKGQTRSNLIAAVEGSLERLQTDRIDLYQLHWPDRTAPTFGTRDFSPPKSAESIQLEDTLMTLKELIDSGKIRYIGLSNETPWGAMKYLELAKRLDLPRMVTIQNSYNLLNRCFDSGLSEICHHEGMRLLAYSPLAFGKLTGKYRHGAMPEGARLSMWERFARYNGPNADAAIEAYAKIADQAGLDLAQMSLAWINGRFHLASNLIGATTMDQLKANIASAGVRLDGEVRQAIEKVHHRFPNPSP